MGVNENLLIFIYFYLFFFVREIAKQRRIHVDQVHASAPKHQQGPKARNGFLQTRSHAPTVCQVHMTPPPSLQEPWKSRALTSPSTLLYTTRRTVCPTTKTVYILSRTQPTRYIGIHSIMSPKPNPFFIIIFFFHLLLFIYF